LKISLDEFPSWLSRELERLTKPATGRGRKLVDEATRALEEGKSFFQDFSRKGERDVGTKRDPVSYRAARVLAHSGKQGFVTVSSVQVTGEVNWESLRAFKDSLSSSSRSLKELRNRAAGEMSGLYILDMRSFSGVSDRIRKNGEKLAGFLEGEGSALQKARTLTGVSVAIQAAVEELRTAEGEVASALVDQKRLTAGAQELAERLDREAGQSGRGEVLEIERELRKESREFRSDTLAHLQRPLRRLRDLSQRGEVPLGVEEREALGLYIELPYRTYLARATGLYLKPILGSLRKAMDSGKLGFKPRKAGRVLAQLDELVSTDSLETRQTRGRELLARRSKLLRNPECNALYASRRETLRNLEMEKKSSEEAAERARILREKARLAEQRVEELLKQAEAKAREYLGREVEIERPKAAVVTVH